jgi:hypothetical protein
VNVVGVDCCCDPRAQVVGPLVSSRNELLEIRIHTIGRDLTKRIFAAGSQRFRASMPRISQTSLALEPRSDHGR